MREDVRKLVATYAAALAKDGATPQGLLWPNAVDLATRFEALLEPLALRMPGAGNRVRLLDIGCGPGLLLDYLAHHGWLDRVDYVGVDVFEETLRHARVRWPQFRFELRDVRERPFDALEFDWALACGVFTGRLQLEHAAMEAMAQQTLRAVWPSTKVGLGFNTMSKHVDWERDDLFHWPLDSIMAFCKADLSRHVSLRLNYGLWEAAVCVRREPLARISALPDAWRAA